MVAQANKSTASLLKAYLMCLQTFWLHDDIVCIPVMKYKLKW